MLKKSDFFQLRSVAFVLTNKVDCAKDNAVAAAAINIYTFRTVFMPIRILPSLTCRTTTPHVVSGTPGLAPVCRRYCLPASLSPSDLLRSSWFSDFSKTPTWRPLCANGRLLCPPILRSPPASIMCWRPPGQGPPSRCG